MTLPENLILALILAHVFTTVILTLIIRSRSKASARSLRIAQDALELLENSSQIQKQIIVTLGHIERLVDSVSAEEDLWTLHGVLQEIKGNIERFKHQTH